MFLIKTILHPTDFSVPSGHAFQLACSLARDHGSRLIVLHVAVPPIVGFGSGLTPPPQGDRQALEDQLMRIRPADPAIQVTHRLEVGSPVAEIVRVAQEVRCDLIVMGTHGRSALAHLLMGNTAEQVVRKAPCAVLTLKGPFPETRSTAGNDRPAGGGTGLPPDSAHFPWNFQRFFAKPDSESGVRS